MMRRLVGLSMAIVLSVGVGSAAAATVRLGAVPHHPLGSRVIGALAPSTGLRLTVALAPRDPLALAAYAARVSDPSSGAYHAYLSVAQFAARFGATPATIAAVRSSLQAHGLSPGAVSANGLSLPVTASAGTVSRAFATSLQRVSLRGGDSGYANTAAPLLDAGIADDVQGIVGLSDLARARPLDLQRHALAHASGVTPCPTATAALGTSDNKGAYTADQIASAYDFGGLYGAGDLGAGQTVAVYELEDNFPSDITAYEKCFGATGTVAYQRLAGAATSASAANNDGVETELDTENVLGLAPSANLIVYQGANTDQGALATYEAIIDQDTAKVLTTSWGECEPDLGQSTAQAENTLFEEAAVQGQTIVAASGDDGVQDCDGDGSTPANTDAAVDDPASQPFVTGVGGTTLTTASPRAETVWNNGPPSSLDPEAGASGGGDSSVWAMPGYQSSAPASLGVINSNSTADTCAATGTVCREVPDVAADGDPNTGYLVYWDGNGQPTDGDAWISVGGTSGASPVWAALFTLANADTACTTSVGFANPSLYAAAASSGAADFNDITTGNNDWLGTNHKVYSAGTGYDQATGLGTPIASALVASLCTRAPLTVTNPGAQTGTVGVPAALQLHASETSVTYAASGLPAGLTLNSATGAISGTPTTSGASSVSIVASDANDRVAEATRFTWAIRPSTVTFAASGAQQGQVGRATSLQLHAADAAVHGVAVGYDAVGLPPGLTASSVTGVISGTPTTAGRYSVAIAATLSGAYPGYDAFTWTIGARPRLSGASLRGTHQRSAVLAFRLTAGADAPALETIALRLPHGVSLARRGAALRKRMSVRSASGARLSFATSRSRGRLVIALRVATGAVTVKLFAPGIGVGARLRRSLTLDVSAGDASGLVTALSARLRAR